MRYNKLRKLDTLQTFFLIEDRQYVKCPSAIDKGICCQCGIEGYENIMCKGHLYKAEYNFYYCGIIGDKQ